MVAEERKKEAEEEEAKRFFNWPQVRADFSHWSKASYWRLEEAIALSFGKDPRQVNWKSIEAHLAVSPFVRRYRDVRDLATRAKAMKRLFDPVLPGFFITWANRMDASSTRSFRNWSRRTVASSQIGKQSTTTRRLPTKISKDCSQRK